MDQAGGDDGRGKRLLRVLAGESVWPPPVWLMRQAGRHLPEYRALRERHPGDVIARSTNPDLATEITLQPIRRYAMDAAILFSDILILPWALGQEVRFAAGEGPVLPPLRSAAALDSLAPARVEAAIQPVLQTVRQVRAAQPAGCTLIGFAGAPFTVACYMVEGGGSRDFAATRTMAHAEPALFARLMDLLTEATILYLSAQIEAGAEAVMLFDSWAGILSPSLFARHVTAPAARIAAALRARHPGTPIIGFPRLAGLLLGEYAAATGIDALALDTAADPARAAALVPGHVALQGNLDPLALLAGGPALDSEARGILQALRGRPHVFNLGHGVLPETPPEHVAALLRVVREGALSPG